MLFFSVWQAETTNVLINWDLQVEAQIHEVSSFVDVDGLESQFLRCFYVVYVILNPSTASVESIVLVTTKYEYTE